MPDEMTRRERLLAAHRGDPVGRPPIKIWGADPWTQVIHPSFQPILDVALEKTDLVANWGIGVNMFYTRPEIIEGKKEDPISFVHLPDEKCKRLFLQWYEDPNKIPY